MTIESLSTLLLTLTGPVGALLTGVLLLVPRSVPRNTCDGWLGIWLIGLAVRFGKSTLHAQLGLEPWAMNLGLAGMAAAPPALFLATRAGAGRQPRPGSLIHLLPAAACVAGAAWIPNQRGDPASAFIYIAILASWAGYTLAAWRVLMSADPAVMAGRRVLQAATMAASALGTLFIAVFCGLSRLYLLNCALFSLSVLAIGTLLAAGTGARVRLRAAAASAASPEQLALARRMQAVMSDREIYADIGMSLVRMGRKMGVPPKRLSAAVNRATGRSFTTLLNEQRVIAAQHELLATMDSVETIASRCGFASASAFHRTFRRHVGQTPAAWRDRLRAPGRVSPAPIVHSASPCG